LAGGVKSYRLYESPFMCALYMYLIDFISVTVHELFYFYKTLLDTSLDFLI